MTVRQVGEQFIERFSKARGKSSWQDDEYNLKALYTFTSAGTALGDRAIGAVTTDDLEAFHKKLRDQRAGSTCNHYRQLLLALFGWAAKKGYIGRDPAADAELPRMTQARRSRRLNDDEERRLLEHANLRLDRLIVAALETGARQGELLALQWRDVDVERRELRIRAENTKDQQDRPHPHFHLPGGGSRDGEARSGG